MFFRRRKRENASPHADALNDPQPGDLDRLIAEITRSYESPDDDPSSQRRLLATRHQAGIAMTTQSPGEVSHPQPERGRFDGLDGVPEVSREELTPELLREAILTSGCLLVRGLIDSDQAEAFRGEIDRAFAARAAAVQGEAAGDGYFEEFVPNRRYDIASHRGMVSDDNGMWLTDSPRISAEWFRLLDRAGFLELATRYLGERPAISVNKSTLRRVRVEPGADYSHSFWHQDGAFMGPVRALNLWLALTPCGEHAPGLDLVPRRLDHVVRTGTDGASFSWSVSQTVAEEVAGETGVARPHFGPGDALLFDELLLHGTALSSEMTERRYAVECWFFGPSAFPGEYPPLAS